MHLKPDQKVLLILILLFALLLRVYGLNWDSGFHLHPDERWITMVVESLHWPSSPTEFLSPQSPLNPKSFAYGSLPFYLLKLAGSFTSLLDPTFGTYSFLNLVGRFLSTLFDLGTIYFIFRIGQKIWDERVGLLAAFLYAIAVFPIQNAHFYTVDTQVTFWSTLLVFLLLKYLEKPNLKGLISIGAILGIGLATKITSSLLLIPILFTLFLQFSKVSNFGFRHSPLDSGPLGLELEAERSGRPEHSRRSDFFCHSCFVIRILTAILTRLTFVVGVSLLTFLVFAPYALLDFPTFKAHALAQSQMFKNPYTFPYTLQYVDTTPYFYFLKNIVFWGIGLPLGTVSILGMIVLTTLMIYIIIVKRVWRKSLFDSQKLQFVAIILVWIWVYFLIMGASAVKFMRYLLPLYPFLVLAAAFLLVRLRRFLLILIVAGGAILYTLSFLSIYSKPNTRVAASNWIHQNIPAGSVLATEHWDDLLPLWDGERYQNVTLALYEPDSEIKRQELIQKLEQADYIILASNRLYVPLMKLEERYPMTSRYYQLLFEERLGFKKAAEFTSYPMFQLLVSSFKFQVNDDSADESFTVYDHPKVMIFRKITPLDYGKIL